MAYELGEQLGLAVARLDRLSDRRRHRHGRHVEGVRGDRAHRLEDAGRAAADGLGPGRALRADRARVRAGHGDARSCGRTRAPIADGLRVPKAIGDFLVLRAVRESGGTALAVTDADMVAGMREIGSHEGISAAPEGGAALQAIKMLVRDGRIKPTESVVLFNTGGALKYLDVLVSAAQSPREGRVNRSARGFRPSGRASRRPSVPERDADRPGGPHDVEIERDVAGPADDLLERHARRCPADGTRPCARTSPLQHELHRPRAEAGGEDAVEAGGRAAALQVPEHDVAGFLAGERLERAGDPRARRRRAARRSRRAPSLISDTCPPTGLAPSATTTMLKRAP